MRIENLTICTTILNSDKSFLSDLIRFLGERGWVIDETATQIADDECTHTDLYLIRGRSTLGMDDSLEGGDDPEDQGMQISFEGPSVEDVLEYRGIGAEVS